MGGLLNDDVEATAPTASAPATLAASSSPDATVGTAAGATATAASTAGAGTEVGTDLVPTTTAPPTTEHISSFLSYIRRHAADDATATAASAAETLASPPPSDVNQVGGAKAAIFSTTGDGMHDDTDSTPPSVADGTHVSAHSHADDDDAVATRSAREAAIPTPKKRRSWCGPAHEASRKAFYAASSSPGMAGGSADGVTAAATTAAGTGMHVDAGPTPPVVTDCPSTSARSCTDDGDAIAPCSTGATAAPSPKKRRGSREPAHEARRKALNASTVVRTTSTPPTGAGAGAAGTDGRGV